MRPIPGGYDIDRWPITVPIRPGETIPGWLMHFAARYQLSPAQLLREFGFTSRPATVDRVLDQVVECSREITWCLGLPPRALSPALCGGPVEASLGRYLAHRRGIRPRFSGSRFCPRCLADPDCIWQREWAHPLLPICLRHRLRLQTRCPGCGQVPFSDTTWLGSHGPPWHCPQRRPRDTADRKVRPFCRHDLRDAAAIDADDNLCTAQRYLTALAEATDSDVPTDRTAATTRFETFCDLAADKLGIDALVPSAPTGTPDHRTRHQT
ncbi:TniQ family protein [Rhodococcus sp. NPDC127530]|uniref:TniQ family protein n=1 Tax=unclassified Rhodococcus (in: high G+C Gram-positive bacteria) TaxID=192944 RepID=UPI0036381996